MHCAPPDLENLNTRCRGEGIQSVTVTALLRVPTIYTRARR